MDHLLELGILPLGEVLLPGIRRQLCLAAERDRFLVGHCLELDEPLAVVYAARTGAVDGPGPPCRTGTIARMIAAAPRADGQLVATVLGLARCRVVSVSQVHPFNKGRVQLVEDDSGDTDSCRRLAAQVVAAFVEYLAMLLTLANRSASEITLPTDSLSLSYAIAATLQVGELERQSLLEADTIRQRLHQTLAILERERILLGRQIACRNQNRSSLGQLSVN